jgi:hypothetical protein
MIPITAAVANTTPVIPFAIPPTHRAELLRPKDPNNHKADPHIRSPPANNTTPHAIRAIVSARHSRRSWEPYAVMRTPKNSMIRANAMTPRLGLAAVLFIMTLVARLPHAFAILRMRITMLVGPPGFELEAVARPFDNLAWLGCSGRAKDRAARQNPERSEGPQDPPGGPAWI